MASLDFVAESLGGRDAFLQHCRLSDSDGIRNFLNIYDTLPAAERSMTTLQDLCTKAALTPTDIIRDLMSSTILFYNNIALMKSAMRRPEVMDASIDRALGPSGFQDGKLQFEIGGLISGEGIKILNQLAVGVNTPGLPSLEEDSRHSVTAVQSGGNPRALPPPSAEYLPNLADSPILTAVTRSESDAISRDHHQQVRQAPQEEEAAPDRDAPHS